MMFSPPILSNQILDSIHPPILLENESKTEFPLDFLLSHSEQLKKELRLLLEKNDTIPGR